VTDDLRVQQLLDDLHDTHATPEAISRSISWTQLSGVIIAETHAACAEMLAKF
jgi:hypothetical protein